MLDNVGFQTLLHDERLQSLAFFAERGIALARFPVLIRKAGCALESIANEIKKHGIHLEDGHKREGFTFIYGLKEDYLTVNRSGVPVAILQDKLSSKAMSVQSFMPFSPLTQKTLNTYAAIPDFILYILRITKCLFDKDNAWFTDEDNNYFDSHVNILDDLSQRGGMGSCLMLSLGMPNVWRNYYAKGSIILFKATIAGLNINESNRRDATKTE